METIKRNILAYLHENSFKYLLFSLLTRSLRVIGVVLIWSTLAYNVVLGTLELVALGVVTILYILLEAGDFSYRKRQLENILSEGGSKWYLS